MENVFSYPQAMSPSFFDYVQDIYTNVLDHSKFHTLRLRRRHLHALFLSDVRTDRTPALPCWKLSVFVYRLESSEILLCLTPVLSAPPGLLLQGGPSVVHAICIDWKGNRFSWMNYYTLFNCTNYKSVTILLLLLLLIRGCFPFSKLNLWSLLILLLFLLSQALSSWNFSSSSGDLHRSCFQFQTAVLPVLSYVWRSKYSCLL